MRVEYNTAASKSMANRLPSPYHHCVVEASKRLDQTALRDVDSATCAAEHLFSLNEEPKIKQDCTNSQAGAI